MPPGQPLAAFVCPGHPLLDAALDLTLERHRDLLKRGTVLVDERDSGTKPRVLFTLEHSMQDASLLPSGERRTISRQMLYVEMDAEGQTRHLHYAPYLDYRPLAEGEPPVADLLARPECSWITRGLEQKAQSHAIAIVVPEHVTEVRGRRLKWIFWVTLYAWWVTLYAWHLSNDHVAIKQLAEHFARYHYLPRLGGPEVLAHSICEGIGLLTWQFDTFAYAESYDEVAKRYRGLRSGQAMQITADNTGLLVKPDVAKRQMDSEIPVAPNVPDANGGGANGGGLVTADGPSGFIGGAVSESRGGAVSRPLSPAPNLRRFHGTVNLDPNRVGRDASRIADEVIAHLAGQVGADVTVTLEIAVTLPDGASEHIIRIVTENSRTLKFTSHGFEHD